MNNILSSYEAYCIAVKEAGLEANSPVCTDITLDGSIYEISIKTLFLRYDFYVGALSGEVLGINFEPFTDLEVGTVSVFSSEYAA